MDLATPYMGLELRNPLVAAASPLSHTLEGVRRLADSGVGAIVLFSLFEEQLREQALLASELVDASSGSSAEAHGYMPAIVAQDVGPRRYLDLLERAVSAVDAPVIASLNAATPEGFVELARATQHVGAAAVELNISHLPADPEVSGRDVEQRHLEIVQAVKAAVAIPVAVKLSPYFSALGEVARRVDDAGADALVLFNRLLAPEIDPERLAVVPRVTLSGPFDARLPRAWIAVLHGRVAASLAASGGVEAPADVAGHLLAGADVVMTASALLRHGPDHAGVLLDGLQDWMRAKGFSTLEQLRGLLAASEPTARSAHGRSGYVEALRAADYSPW
jgi:dihydroorotate dehydrogenase (fumarate)